MPTYEGEYSGAALQSFIRGLKQSPQIITAILRKHGIDQIDPNAWYKLETARAIYADIGKMIGNASLSAVGVEIINSAVFPPGINDVKSALESIQPAYEMNVRGRNGSNLGRITCEFLGKRRARMTFSTPFPCALDQGIIQGCAKRFGATALIVHSPGCRDQGAEACTYTVDWLASH
ncbi:MAG: hypothetical protein KatS3mg057_0121 [Herpetosiphonaceae bacterium]|nr:MAG: hypothetical protein KatS3mg057_0121 [Herpetosiphonaceae bacterium]